MFNNLINAEDARLLLERLRGGQLRRVLRRVFRSHEGRTRIAWERTETPPTNWWDVPAVRERWNEKISGDREIHFHDYVSGSVLAGRSGLRALSLGCGTGSREQAWAALGKFERIDAYDLSEAGIAFAREEAERNGHGDTIRFHVANIYDIDLAPESYDVITTEGALHHFTPLRDILERIASWLREDGFFVLDEFVGPTQFQWTNRQLEAINGLLESLPDRYRAQWGGKTLKRPVHRPSRLMIRFGDPSEAVESGHILPLIRELFNVVEIKPYGGTLLHMLLHTIAHHFTTNDPEAARHLQRFFDEEDRLLDSGELESDFVTAICRKAI